MTKCPQCNADRIPDEIFCDSCGHKYAAESKVEANTGTESFDNYEKDYLKRMEAPRINESVKETNENSEPRGAIWIPSSNGGEQPIYFEFERKTIGRMDVSEYLKSQNIDPLQVSRKQFTFYIENEKYYIVDGTNSVQEKPSGNHTTVNGKDITEQGAIELNSEDKIGMSRVLNITFRVS
ncbi:MAG TPA: FHA domain-containing protein [Nitrosopumilus sp.]|nr:FHA domain-containing protein [Nitrosopumilus sp.]